ncbi:MAG TPA: hypothetical protein VKM94_12580 [Blastocatellia bacterium]|nr:hypothetical protein [Blastocatellia bacterium]
MIVRLLLPICILVVPALAQSQSPTQAALSFYQELRARRYVEGFRHSVYRKAVEGLSAEELKDLEPDFLRTFSQIPDKIEPTGEKIDGDAAIVSLKFGAEEVQSVALVRSGGEWLVGDRDTLDTVNHQGRAFFFNSRILVNEGEAYEMLQQIIGAELIYARKFEGKCANLEELIKLGGVPADLKDGTESGYKFDISLRPDRSAFYVTATPVVYAKTGRVSLYADINGIRGDDLKGKPAGPQSPVYRLK